jgi:hypothetical protein
LIRYSRTSPRRLPVSGTSIAVTATSEINATTIACFDGQRR